MNPLARTLLGAGLLGAPLAAQAEGVRGCVVDELGLPLEGVTVTLLPLAADEADPPRTTTGRDGCFALPAPANASAIALHHDHFAARIARRVPPATALDVGRLTLPEVPGLLVHVVARGPGQRPLAGAAVDLRPALSSRGEPDPRRTRTDAVGVAVFLGVMPGPWVVEVVAEGHPRTEVEHLQPERPGSAPTLRVALEEGRTVRGRVVAGDDAVEDAELVAVDRRGRVHARAKSTTGGQFALADLPPAPVDLVACHPAHGRAEQRIAGDGALVVLHLDAGRTVRGEVVHARTGEPVAGAEVVAGGAGWPPIAEGRLRHPAVRADAQGKFLLRGVPPGIVRVVATSDGLCPADTGPVSRLDEPLRLQLAEAAHVSGRVLMPDGSATTTTTMIELCAEDGTTARSAPCDAAGRFALPGVLPGNYRLVARATDLAPLALSLAIGAGERRDLGELRLRRGATVAGVARAGADPARFATVHLEPGDGGQAQGPAAFAVCDDAGRFRFAAVTPGPYRLFFDYPDEDPPRAAAESRERTEVQIEVREREHLHRDLTLRAP